MAVWNPLLLIFSQVQLSKDPLNKYVGLMFRKAKKSSSTYHYLYSQFPFSRIKENFSIRNVSFAPGVAIATKNFYKRFIYKKNISHLKIIALHLNAKDAKEISFYDDRFFLQFYNRSM